MISWMIMSSAPTDPHVYIQPPQSFCSCQSNDGNTWGSPLSMLSERFLLHLSKFNQLNQLHTLNQLNTLNMVKQLNTFNSLLTDKLIQVDCRWCLSSAPSDKRTAVSPSDSLTLLSFNKQTSKNSSTTICFRTKTKSRFLKFYFFWQKCSFLMKSCNIDEILQKKKVIKGCT